MNTDEAQIVLRSQAAVTGESGRGLPHSTTLARSSCTPRIYPKYGRLKSAEKGHPPSLKLRRDKMKTKKLNQIKPD